MRKFPFDTVDIEVITRLHSVYVPEKRTQKFPFKFVFHILADIFLINEYSIEGKFLNSCLGVREVSWISNLTP